MSEPGLRCYTVRATQDRGPDKRPVVRFFDYVPIDQGDPQHPYDRYGEHWAKMLTDAGVAMSLDPGVHEVPVYAVGQLAPVGWLRRRP